MLHVGLAGPGCGNGVGPGALWLAGANESSPLVRPGVVFTRVHARISRTDLDLLSSSRAVGGIGEGFIAITGGGRTLLGCCTNENDEVFRARFGTKTGISLG